MRQRLRAPLLLPLVCAMFAQAASAAPPGLTGNAAAAEVRSTFETWLHAYEVGDLDRIMAIFDTGVIFEFQGGKDQSWEDLRQGYVSDLKARAPGTKWVPTLEEIHSDGTLAFVRSIWELRVSSNDGPDQTKARNRSMDVFRKAHGHWYIIRSINYPEKG